jgi:hypothetical protein
MTPYHPQSTWRHQRWLIAACWTLIGGTAVGLVLLAVTGGGQ